MYRTEFTANQIENVRNLAISILDDKSTELMKVSTTNRKLNHLAEALGIAKTQVVAIDGLAGHTCPFADICLAKVVVDDNGRRSLEKGANCEFTCYAAKLEAVYGNVYKAHKHNTDIVNRTKDVELLAAIILASIWAKSPSIKRKGGVVRWHSSGDFHKKHYVEAAALVALAAPDIVFFGYSKSPWVVAALTNDANSYFVHSHGSKFDAQADDMELPQNYVRCSDKQYPNIPTACPTSMVSDDYFFILAQKSFAINVH